MSKLSTSIRKENIIVSERNNPLWERLLATIFYIVALIGIYIYVTNVDFSEAGHVVAGTFVIFIFEGIFLTLAFQLSAVSAIHFDLDNNQYKKVYNIGFLQLGFWKPLPFIEYISILRYAGSYEVQLKFLDEEEFIIFYADTYKEIFSLAYDTAKQINVGFYDAIINNRQYWVDLNKGKEELLKEIGLYKEPEVVPTCIFPTDDNFTKSHIKEVTEGQKELYKQVLSAVFFTIGFVYIFFFTLLVTALFTNDFNFLFRIFSPTIILLLLAFLVPIIASIFYFKSIVVVKQIQFDIKHNIFRTVADYGWLKRKQKWVCIPNTDYISIFYQAHDNGYEITLFQTNKKSIELFSGNNLGETFRLGYEVAKILNVELLNATNWDDQYWVDLTQSKEALFQELIDKNRK